MKKIKLIALISILLGLFFAVGFVFASSGAIDGAYKYAWSANAGWINFAPTDSNGNYVGLTVADSAVTGYAWSQNYGWINFAPTGEGGVV